MPLFQSQTSSILGTVTNDSAAAGNIGQEVVSTVPIGSAAALTSGVPSNVTSVSLTAGDWNLFSTVDYDLVGATVTDFKCGPSLTAATLPTQMGGGGLGAEALASQLSTLASRSNVMQIVASTTRLSIAATTTVYLVAQSAFSLGTVAAFGTLRARRGR